ncbi:MAG: PKD domain-containing protein, partial [Thermoplasmata archaeon]|nr:PKD domain-containing protein [Thermoplasmata archaeon]
MAFDPAQDGIVLFGGVTSTVRGVVENQTWLWSNWTWSQLTLPWSPPRLAEAVLAWDSTVGGLVLAGGSSEWETAGPGIQNNASFAFVNGTWTNLTPVGGFPGAVGAGAGYDPSSGGLLLFGGLGRHGDQNSTWLLDRAPAVSIVASRVLEDAGVPFGFSDPLAGAASGQTLRWAFGDGTSGTGSGPTHAFAKPGTYSVNLTGTLGNLGEVLTSWAMTSVTIVASPLAKVAVGNGFVDVNGYESATATAAYGVGPYTINWSFGDGASVSGGWSVNHRYLTPGNFTIQATVTDSLGGTTMAEVPVHVQPYPRVALQVAQMAYDLGQSIWLHSATQYGSAPFTFSYSGLPPGCATENVANYTCEPSSSGTYDVQVTIADANQLHVTSGLVVVNVAPPLSGALNASARVVDLGTSVTVGAELASEGSGNASVSFSSGLLCLVVGPLGELCSPTSPGTYGVTGTATDLSGARAALTPTDFVVHPALGLHATEPSAPVDRGTSVTLGVSVVGGTPPFHVSFESVPHGCYAENSTSFRCDLELAGTYSLSASVTDGVGST